jgi:ABC-2 type transport system permease protein
MVALRILRRDLLRFIRNPVRTALLFAMPLVLAGIFVVVFGGNNAEDITIRVLLWDEDGGLLTRLLEGASGSEQAQGRLDLVSVGPEGLEMMDNGEASALLHLPQGFTTDYLAGREVTAELVKNPAERFLPRVVEEGAGIGAAMLSQASQVFRDEMAILHTMVTGDGFPSDLAVAAMSTGINRKLRGLEQYLLPPIVELESATVGDETETDVSTTNILTYFLPGLSLMGILFLAKTASQDILRDRETGLMAHLLTAPVSIRDYLGGKCLSVLTVSALGFALLVCVGVVAGVDWGPPVPVAALVIASALAASGTVLAIMSLANSERQGDAITTVVIIVWSLVGGACVPISQIPSSLLPLSRSTLVYWASDGFNTLVVEGGGMADITVNLAVLTVAGAALVLLGVLILRRKMTRGTVR